MTSMREKCREHKGIERRGHPFLPWGGQNKRETVLENSIDEMSLKIYEYS